MEILISKYKKWKLVTMLSIIIINFLSFINSEVDIKFLNTAVEINDTVLFEWSDANINDYDAKIVFYKNDVYPTQEDHYVETCFNFLNSESSRKSHPEKYGKIKVKAPSQEGLYKMYYCAKNPLDGFYCQVGKPIVVLSCKNKIKNLKTSSKIEHLIVIISENHSFDSIYGNYCTAEPYSSPNCNFGSECCESIPKTLNNLKPVILSDVQNSRHDPCHQSYCETSEINGGKMDKYLINGVGSNPQNFAAAIDDLFSAKYYFDWARRYAISDAFFQSSSGASCQNDMFFATAKFIFKDNEVRPQKRELNGMKCYDSGFKSYYDPTIADLLNVCKVQWTFYSEGYDEYPKSGQCYPQFYDASDNPFTYFPSLTDSPTADYNFRDYKTLNEDIRNETLPAVSYVKFLGIHSEHPGYDGSFLTGQMLSDEVIQNIMASQKYNNNTLIILVPDESGGFYDHVNPPVSSTIDGTQYGPRTQFITVGNMVKKNYVSHVHIEPSSIIKFIEWNFIGDEGQLYSRDRFVNNIGDLIDSNLAGEEIPSSSSKEKETSYTKSDKSDSQPIKNILGELRFLEN